MPVDLPFVEDWGALGDGVNDDRASIQAAMNAEKGVFFRNRPYIIDGGLTLRTSGSLNGFGPSNSDGYRLGVFDTCSPKLLFTGTAASCIVNADPLTPINHGGLYGLVIRATGDYDCIIDFKECQNFTFDRIRAETSNPATAGIRSTKLTPGSDSWVNTMTNCCIRLPDNSNRRSLNVDWSDSTIVASHFCGGVGVIESGYGVKFIGGSIERSSYAGLTIRKVTTIKNTRCIGVQFDANACHGVLVDTTGDTTGNRWLDVSINGCDFRTVSPTTGAPGASNIHISTTAPYSGGVIGMNTHMVQGVAAYGFTPSLWSPTIGAESRR